VNAESASLPSRRLFHEVSHGLPSCSKLRLILGDVVPEGYVPGSSVIHHSLLMASIGEMNAAEPAMDLGALP